MQKSKDLDKKKDGIKKKIASVLSALAALAFSSLVILYYLSILKAPARAKIIAAVFVASQVAGSIIVLVLRFKEIDKGEEYDSRKY